MRFDATQPIWLQLVDEFARRIAAGEWQPGARISAVRDLAGELTVNPNTVQRAFGELERDGLVRSERTAGRFVTDDAARIRALRRRLAGDAADDFARRSLGVGLSLSDAQTLLAERWNDDDPDRTESPSRAAG
jgi:GntR family transcriptional regulator